MVGMEGADGTVAFRTIRRLLLLASVILVFYVLVGQVSPLVHKVDFDQSNLIYDAHRLAEGQVPYRDFFCFLPPGNLYLMSGGPWAWWGRPETGVRYLCLGFVLVTWLVVFLTLKKVAPRREFPAGAISALVPVCLFPFAAFSTHHWMGDALYICAIALASSLWRGPARRGQWFLLGLLVGTVACFLQTAGALALIVLVFSVLTSSRDFRTLAAKSAASAAGVVTAWFAFVGPLLVLGAGKAYCYDVYRWTLLNYRRPGNINSEPFLVDLPSRIKSLWRLAPEGSGPDWWVHTLSGTLLYAGLCILAGGMIFSALFVLFRIARTKKLPSPAMITASVITFVTLGIFTFTRSDWTHLIVLFPPVLFLWAIVLAETGYGVRLVRVMRAALTALLVCGLSFVGVALLRHPPRPWEILNVDRVDRESPLDRSLRASRLLHPGDSIVVLPSGGNIYLYTYPAAIGYTYLFPLDDGYNTLRDHRVAAKEIETRKPEMILIHRIREPDFMNSRSPLAKVIRNQYVLYGRTPALDVFVPRSRDGGSAR